MSSPFVRFSLLLGNLAKLNKSYTPLFFMMTFLNFEHIGLGMCHKIASRITVMRFVYCTVALSALGVSKVSQDD